MRGVVRRVADIVGVWKGRKRVLRCRHPAEFEWLLFGSKDSGKREKREAELQRAPHHHDCAIVILPSRALSERPGDTNKVLQRSMSLDWVRLPETASIARVSTLMSSSQYFPALSIF